MKRHSVISKNWLWIFVLVIVALSWRLYWAYRGYFPFTWDFARDMLWVRKLTVDFEPMLVGAWGSLQGTFFGPLYFYMLAPPLLLFIGDPRAAVGMVTAFTALLVPLSYWWGRKMGMTKAALVWAGSFALLPWFSFVSLYSFPQHIIPLWYFGLLLSQWWFLRKPLIKRWFLVWIVVGLGWNFEPADVGWAGGVSLFIGLVYLWNKPFKRWVSFGLSTIVGLFVALLPNILFDIRNDWIQLKGFYSLLMGTDTSYGDSIPIWLRFTDRWRIMSNLIAAVLFFHNRWIFWVVVGSGIIFGWIKKIDWKRYLSRRQLKLITLLAVHLVSLYLYFLLFPKLLKDYYLYVLPVMIVLTVGVMAEIFWNKRRQGRVWLLIGMGLWIAGLWTFEINRGVYKNQAQYYEAQKQVVDELYKRAGGKAFKAYVYTPVIYDYPYQYLFSWHGYKTYGYLPVDYSYLPNQPEYVYKKSVYDEGKETRSEASEDGVVPTFLVREPSQENQFYGRTPWLDNFPGAELVEPDYLPNGFEIRVWNDSSI